MSDSRLLVERVYDAHAGALYSWLLQLTRHEADTRDLLQEVFLRLARNPAALHDVRRERAFLLRMAYHAFLDLLRRRHTRERGRQTLAAQSVAVFQPAENPDANHLRVALESALADLPPDQRAVLHLKLWEGLTFEAISDLLDIPLNTAASRYRYGLDKIRTRLRPLYEEIR